MKTKTTIDKKMLDGGVEKGVVELEGMVFAYFPDSDKGNPSYTIFVNTSGYDILWEEVTRNFSPIDDWGEKLKEVYEKQPELKEKLSKRSQYKVPSGVLEIPHEEGGGHGELRLRYEKANIMFFPIKDYMKYFKGDDRFLRACKILLTEIFPEGTSFLKGDTDLLNKYGVCVG